ncbi:hypothetical protein KIH75_01905 [Bifidobacterium sp. 64T4]|uniref:hypothetical protein n=1 Tax=Bifidobacterium pongonis TaxID=2834432 RepID=UPI001C58DCA4|nr:hypothetical protein [Bifidobacterium pongonis]MBW3094121.1 hypothetical protein [Bifidobacterium pongonis]
MTNLDDLTILERTERYSGYVLDCARTSTGMTGANGARRTLHIAGRLYVPAELIDGTELGMTFPTVIISHGFNDTYDHTSEHARYLASRGIISTAHHPRCRTWFLRNRFHHRLQRRRHLHTQHHGARRITSFRELGACTCPVLPLDEGEAGQVYKRFI